jgi:hypothetical protein
MFILRNRHRPGTTLVELLMFTAFFAVSSSVFIVFFISTSEQRIRQQVISTVEQSGIQLMQTLSNRVRSAERVLGPVAASSGTVLALQLSDESYNPTIMGLSGSQLFVAEANTIKALSADNISLSDFSIYNTSVADARASVLIRFTITQSTEVTVPISYQRTFESAISLFPDDIASAQCGCTVPQCNAGTYEWQYCEEDVCADATVLLPC